MNDNRTFASNCAETVPSEIPMTAKEFQEWGNANHAEWPPELITLAIRAGWALEAMNQKAFNESEVMQRECAKDLMAFAEAYGAWKATR